MKFTYIIISLITLVAVSTPATGQYGFNKKVSFLGSAGLDFDDIILDENSIVVRGNIYIDSLDLWGLFVCQLDTLGQIIWKKTVLDSSRTNDIISNTPTRFIKSTDRGYLLPVNNFGKGTMGLYKLTSNGDFLFSVEFENEEKSIIPNYLIETTDNYYISGYQQRANLGIDVFLLKTDLNGNQIWLKYFGSDTLNEYSAGLILNNNNTITLGCQIRPPNYEDLPFEYQWRRPWLLTLDTSGAVVKEWKGEQNDSRTKGGFGLINTPEGDWGMIYTEVKKVQIGINEYILGRPSISVLDSNFNLIWKAEIGEFNSYYNSFFDVEFDPIRNEWVAVGQQGVGESLMGCIAKFSNKGNIRWIVYDTAIYDPNNSRHFLGGVSISSTGSIYSAGYIENSNPPYFEFGWILKVTPDGCVDTLCTTTSILNQVTPKRNISLFPNPAFDFVTLEWSNQDFKHSIIEFFNITGSLILRQEMLAEKEVIDIGKLDPGPIFYKIVTKGSIVQAGTFIKN